MNDICNINYEYNEFCSLLSSDNFFKNRFSIYKIIKENNNKITMIVYCSILQKLCFLKVKIFNNSPNKCIDFDVYELLKKNNHDNIEIVYDIIVNKNFIYILTEYISGTNLAQLHNILNKEILKKIINQTYEGLNYIHKLNIIHGDIKLENIMFTNNQQIKIIDFDLSRICNNYISSKILFGSENYIAPESFDLHIYSKKSDVWSFGISLYKLILNKFPYKYKLNKSCHLRTRNNFKCLNLQELDILVNIYGTDIINIIKKMLNFVDDNRPLNIKLEI